jgi:cyclopropane fatty-acyl-phospholipid synthase-like methyltransferase
MSRAGIESEAVHRLVQDVGDPDLQTVLLQCLEGSISPPVALMRLLIETEDAGRVRGAVDDVTRRAAMLSRSGDNLVRDRVDDLTQLVVENEDGLNRIAEMLRANMDSSHHAASEDEGIAFCERLFDWSVQQSEEASVALYSLGSAELLERATDEIVAQLEHWGVISADRDVLDIGCGIGRLEVALSPRVRSIHGVDVSSEMINAAQRRTSGFRNVDLLKGTGRDLRAYADGTFDTIVSVDTFPYLNQSGASLVEKYFAECARVLKPEGDLVILNFAYGSDESSDDLRVREMAIRYGFDVIVSGDRPFALWDGTAFHLKRKARL